MSSRKNLLTTSRQKQVQKWLVSKVCRFPPNLAAFHSVKKRSAIFAPVCYKKLTKLFSSPECSSRTTTKSAAIDKLGNSNTLFYIFKALTKKPRQNYTTCVCNKTTKILFFVKQKNLFSQKVQQAKRTTANVR